MTRFLKHLTIAAVLVLAWPASADVVDVQDDYLNHGNSAAYVELCDHEFAGGELPDAARVGLRTVLAWYNSTGSSKYFWLKVTVQPQGGGETTLYEDYSAPYSSLLAGRVVPLELWVTSNTGAGGGTFPFLYGSFTQSVQNVDGDGDTSMRTGTTTPIISDLTLTQWDLGQPWTMRVYLKHSVANQSLSVTRWNCGWYVE